MTNQWIEMINIGGYLFYKHLFFGIKQETFSIMSYDESYHNTLGFISVFTKSPALRRGKNKSILSFLF